MRDIKLDRELRFGSHLFVNPEDTVEELKPRMEALASAGFTLIRLFMVWDLIEPKSKQYKWTIFDQLFDLSAQMGFKLVPTLMSVSPPGWMRKTYGIQEVADLDDPDFFAQAIDFTEQVVNRYKDHPSLDSWILWNEPGRSPETTSPHVLKAYQAFLEASYGKIEHYNSNNFQQVESFHEIAIPKVLDGFITYQGRIDWLRFCVENLHSHIQAIAQKVVDLDPNHPIHINPHRISQCLADVGQSLWKNAEAVDFMGCSAHPSWHSTRYPRERYGDSIALFADITRSATEAPDQYFWVTELQGGTTLMSANVALHPSPDETAEWLMQCVASSTKAVIYWCTNARNNGFEAGEWDLLNYDGEPTKQLKSIEWIIKNLYPYMGLLAEAKPPKADMLILVSEEAAMLDLVEGTSEAPSNLRNIQKSTDAVAGAYFLACDLSLEVDFMDSRRLLEAPIEGLPKIIVIPSATVLSKDCIEHLNTIVESGHQVIADGFFAWKTPHGALAKSCWPSEEKLWGSRCIEYSAIDDNPVIETQYCQIESCFMRAHFKVKSQTKVVAHWEDGSPAITQRECAGGQACRLGTVLFQRYLNENSTDLLNWFHNLVEPYIQKDQPKLVKTTGGIRLRRLSVNEQPLCIALNRSDKVQSFRIQWKGHISAEYSVSPHNAVILQAEDLQANEKTSSNVSALTATK
ncbi:beta-galactosidase [Puniceicoccus vermicola]|uniref:beta-galactosidase n=1 Tax=Puniceicoccus vermicola TaxID=388746 RepID=A0A7X1AUN8_9BACT|nr:beta-galactosidase [Puniceicoccus vermicola]MBC2600340.1 beta-galactosidase [Puniceicoccus vermicola]